MNAIDSRYDNPCKMYVGVDVRYTAEGVIIPLAIIWEDGRVFSIDDVTDVRKAASLKAGGCGIRFTCSIMGKMKYLFLEEDRFFIEAKGAN